MHELRKAKNKELGVLHTIVGKKLGKWFCSAQAVRYQMKKVFYQSQIDPSYFISSSWKRLLGTDGKIRTKFFKTLLTDRIWFRWYYLKASRTCSISSGKLVWSLGTFEEQQKTHVLFSSGRGAVCLASFLYVIIFSWRNSGSTGCGNPWCKYTIPR